MVLGLHGVGFCGETGRERAAKGNYREVELGFSDTTAQIEADRCLRCYRMAMVAL